MSIINSKIKIDTKYWNILTTIKIYILAIFIFFCFRLILFFTQLDRIDNSVLISDIIYSFIMGLRFDIVISGYIMILPYLIFTIYNFFPKLKILKTTIHYFIFILFSLAFIVCAADIPFFNQFFTRFNVMAFDWANSPMFVLKMIVEEPRYWLFIIPLALAIFIFYKLLFKIINNDINVSSDKIVPRIIFSIIFILLIFLGIRGRIAIKSPIRTGTAYFCNNPFLNQLGLNPNFTFIRSVLDSKKEENQQFNLMEDKIAIKNVQNYFNITNPDNEFPILRKENYDSINCKHHNIVIIIMESMSAAFMERHGNPKKLTPFLDSIANLGYYFENAYSAGIHTHNGIFSTIFSYPAFFRIRPMNESTMLRYHGIASTLKKYNYSTIYFATHDGQFDNVEGFLKNNDFEHIITTTDYPSNASKTILGVPDDYMFEYSIPILNDLNKKGKPFLSVFMTGSNHGPFYIPDYFKPNIYDIKDQIVEYSDFSIQKFIQLCSVEKWFDNTIFVLLADHGFPISAIYDLSIDYNHSPLIFYAPKIIKKNIVFKDMAGQIDVFPSIMGLLGLPFDNNTFGINLFKDSRPYIYFNADDKYGVIDQNWLLIVRRDNFIGLYKYKDKDLTNYANSEKEIVNQMKTYAESNLQASQYLIRNRKI